MLRLLIGALAAVALVGASYYAFTRHSSVEPRKDELSATPPAAPAPAPTPAPAPVQPAPQQQARVEPPAPVVKPASPTPAPDPVAVAPTLKRAKRTHIVQPGESLSSISSKYFGTPNNYGKIAEANGLRVRDRIRVGQVLALPDLPVKVVEADTAATDNPEHTVEHTANVSGNGDFEPQPPTLNVTKPKPKL